MRTLILLRHGDAERVSPTAGQRYDPPLSAVGISQAGAAADRLQRVPVHAIFSSPLQRASQTADAVAKKQSGAGVTVLDALAEVYLGEFEGLGSGDLAGRSAYDSFVASGETALDLIPGAEPANAFVSRVRSGTVAVNAAAASDGPVLVVAHSFVIRQMVADLVRGDPACLSFPVLSALALIRFVNGDRGELVSYNDTWHLQDAIPAFVNMGSGAAG